MNHTLLVSGGEQRENANQLSHGQRYKKAKLYRIDWAAKQTSLLLEHISPPSVRPDRLPSITFAAMTLEGDRLYLCTSTEVLVYRYPSLERMAYTSHPLFQEMHHVKPFKDSVVVVSTGLDLVVYLDKDTLEPVRFQDVLFRNPWDHLDKSFDYRKVNSTKPHASHPNFLLDIKGELWVTRFEQRDIVCLHDETKRVAIDLERIHDGTEWNGKLYLTTVNGKLVVIDIEALAIEKVIDLNVIDHRDGPLGWCRGLHVEDGIAFVGFSRLRSTRIRENIRWTLDMLRSGQPRAALPTRVCAYDLRAGKKIDEVRFGRNEMSALFGVVGLGNEPC